MSESLQIPISSTRSEVYESLIPQILSLTIGEGDLIANLANISAALKQAFGFFWVGFYLEKNGELVLGPFQGPIACTRIKLGRGVCGTSFSKGETILVPDVELFPGHIACSSESKSEIVLPLFDKNEKLIGVLDIDSDKLNDFSELDVKYLEELLGNLKL